MSGKSLIFLFFPGQGESQGISFLAREFYDIAIKKSGKGQGIVEKNSAHNIVVR